MKKSLLALVAAIVILALVLVLNRKKDEAQDVSKYAFDTTQSAAMAMVETHSATDTAKLESKQGQWVVVEDGFPADTAKINRLSEVLYHLQTQDMVSTNPERAAEYGLDSANVKTVIWKDQSGKVVGKVAIGKTSGADFRSTYWKFLDHPEVYRTPGNFSYEIATRVNEWKEKHLFPQLKSDIQFIETNWKDSAGTSFQYRLEALNDTTWRMLSPQANPVKRELAQEMATQVMNLTIDDFLSDADTNKVQAALDSPSVAITVDYKGGKSVTLKAGASFAGMTYALHPSRSDTVKVGTWHFDAFKKKPFELIEPPKDTAVKADSAQHAAE